MIGRLLLSLLFGVLEGVSEWLPISSTGHLILLEHITRFPVRAAFFSLFEVVIQLGAMLAVVVLYFTRLNPFARGKGRAERLASVRLWGILLLATLPCAILGLLCNDALERYLYNPPVVAAALMLYGIAFILLEMRKKRTVCLPKESVHAKTAFGIGLFQVLSLVPGTSRSGATVLGGMLLGLSRTAAAEFSFFLGIPTMLGASLLKAFHFFAEGYRLTGEEILLLCAGAGSAFLMSLLTIRTLLSFVRRHSFAAFGVYRILLGGAVLLTLLF